MAFQPPVSIPSLSDRNYARDLYGMMSGVGDAFRQNRRDKIGDEQWATEQDRLNTAQALAQSNADRNYALELRRLEEGAASDDYGLNLFYLKDADGNIIPAQTKKSGGYKPLDMPDGMSIAKGEWKDQGAYWVYVDPAGNIVQSMPKTGGFEPGTGPAPGAYPQTFSPGQAPPPPGGEGGTGAAGGISVAPYPGSKPAREAEAYDIDKRMARTAAFNGLGVIEEKARVLQAQINGIREDGAEGLMSTGFGGRVERALPWETSGSRLNSRLDTVKNVIVRDTLQQMRDMSKTGGAVGQVSDFETRLYAASQGPLDPNNPTTMMETIDNIEKTYNQAVVAYRIAYMIDHEGLDQQTGLYAIDAIRQGEDPHVVMQAVQSMGGR